MHSAVRVVGWSLLISGLIGVAWPERPDFPQLTAAEFQLQQDSYEPPPDSPRRPPGGGCPTATCLHLNPPPLPSLPG